MHARPKAIDTHRDMPMPDLSQARAPGLLRRLAVMIYDLLLLGAVLIAAAFVYTLPAETLFAADLTEGSARLGFRVYLLAVIIAYYVYFWSGGRQTLGMRTWRLLILRDDGEPLRTTDALRRLGWALLTLAPAGLGLWWLLFDRDGLAWYDRLSGTRPVLVRRPRAGAVAGDPQDTEAAS
jgi:uncharacterized RDD family membrane protein YckC